MEKTCITVDAEHGGALAKQFVVEESSETAEASQLSTVLPTSADDSDDDVAYTHGMSFRLRTC